MSLVEYVKALEIEVALVEPYTAAKGGTGKQGLVDGGSLVSFVGDISSQHRSDCLNSTLLAQLAATKKFDGLVQTKEWYKMYVEVLGKLGWVIQKFNFDRYNVSGQTLVVEAAIIDVAKMILSGPSLKTLENTLTALGKTANVPAYDIFSSKSSGPSSKGNFQVSTCNEDASGQVIMGMACFHFSATVTKDRFLWVTYNSSDISLFKASQVLTLDEDVYSQVREIVIEKLGNSGKKFIKDLDI